MPTSTSTIVCGIDWTSPPRLARVAADLAQRLDARLVLAHAVVDVVRPRARNEAERADIRANEVAAGEEMLRGMASAAGIEGADLRCAIDEPVRWLAALAREEAATMIVVAPRDLHPLRKLVSGSVSAALARRAACPVLAVPRPLLQTPAGRART